MRGFERLGFLREFGEIGFVICVDEVTSLEWFISVPTSFRPLDLNTWDDPSG